MYAQLKQQIVTAGLENTFIILGDGNGISNDQAMQELMHSDIFVLPSIETEDRDAEGIPNTILEAAYFKKPIISTKSGSIPEFVKDNETGILVEQKNANQIADAIKRLSEDTVLASKLGENARAVLADKFDLAKNVIKLESLLLE